MLKLDRKFGAAKKKVVQEEIKYVNHMNVFRMILKTQPLNAQVEALNELLPKSTQ